MDGPGRALEPPCGPAGAGAGTPAGEHAWVRLVPWWHVGFAATVVTTSAFAAFNLQSTGRLAAMLSLYAGLALWYVLLPAKFSSRKAGHIYLAGALAIFVAAEFTYPGSGFLFFILIPQCFVLLRLRTSYVAVIGLLVVGAAAELSYSGVNQATVASVALFGVISLVFAFLLGGCITRIIEQSHQRAVLIEDLERTRAELAEVSREAGALAERERSAREIDDALAQGFTSVITSSRPPRRPSSGGTCLRPAASWRWPSRLHAMGWGGPFPYRCPTARAISACL